MASPFPGMDLYLEGHLWQDFHHTLTGVIRKELVRLLPAKYIALVEHYVVRDTELYHELGIMYPDVEILKKPTKAGEPEVAYQPKSSITPPTLTFEVPAFLEVKIPLIKIIDKADNRLITVIEIISPVNKHEPGFSEYEKKCRNLYASAVHLLEIDLLRRGKRRFQHPALEAGDYLIALTRGSGNSTDLWSFQMKDPLPVVPVPLAKPDPDVPLNLPLVFQTAYEDAGYSNAIDYTSAPPPPELSEEEQAWMKHELTRISN